MSELALLPIPAATNFNPVLAHLGLVLRPVDPPDLVGAWSSVLVSHGWWAGLLRRLASRVLFPVLTTSLPLAQVGVASSSWVVFVASLRS